LGATYWLMPANVFLAGSLGAGRSSIAGQPVRLGVELPNTDASDLGPSLHLSAGKQFWLSRRWGLGISLGLLASGANNPRGGVDTDRYWLAASLALTATFH
jgi:hypothetical protein